MSDQVADVLDAAADIIERRGWAHGRGRGPEGQVCIAIALRTAVEENVRKPWFEIPQEYQLAVERVSSLVGSSIVTWNDHPSRTATEVLDVLRLAAKLERE